MAKIGTAHIEVKPVLNQEALDLITQQIEDAVAAAVTAGLQRQSHAGGPLKFRTPVYTDDRP